MKKIKYEKKQLDFGFIVALPVEYTAVLSMLDEYDTFMPTKEDPNIYIIGSINTKTDIRRSGFYKVVVAQCPKMGNNGAAMVAKDLIRTFGIKHIIMVGIAAGVPSPKNPEKHVRLGDVVISYGKGVVQYDFTKNHPDGSREIRSALPPPSSVLLRAVDLLEAMRLKGENPWEAHISRAGKLGERPKPESDKLYILSGKKHPSLKKISHPKDNRSHEYPKIHYGLIGSGNCLLKDIRERNDLSNKYGILALEMEGAGIADASWNQTEVSDYLIIRGISDYADKKKNDAWHSYAAVTAAAYLRALIEIGPIPFSNQDEDNTSYYSESGLSKNVGWSEDIICYLKWVRNSSENIIIRDGNKVIGLPLATTFVSPDLSNVNQKEKFEVSGGADLEPLDFFSLWPRSNQYYFNDTYTIPAESVLGINANSIIIGAPGAGKTTILQYIAYMLSDGIVEGLLTVNDKLKISGILPIPVFIPLNAFADHLQTLPPNAAPTERTLLRFVEYYVILRQATLRLPSEFFVNILSRGQKIVLLLDGLDEIADESQRIEISRAIQDLAQTPYLINFVVTSRPNVYYGETLLPPSFQTFNIRPLSHHTVRIMIGKIFKEIYKDEFILKKSIDELIASIELLDERRTGLSLGHGRLVDNPLMLRIFVTLYQRHESVAVQKTKIFSDYINTLLQVSYHPDIKVAHRLSNLSGSLSIQMSIFARIAFELHIKSEDSTSFINKDNIEKIITSHLLKTKIHNDDIIKIKDQFLKLIQHRGGLLEINGNEFRFSHLAFQEFLVGLYLTQIMGRPQAGIDFFSQKGRLYRSWWRGPLVHYVGLMHFKSDMYIKQFIDLLINDIHSASKDKTKELAKLEAIGEACIETQVSHEQQKDISFKIQKFLFNKTIANSMDSQKRAFLGRIIGKLGDQRTDANCSPPKMVKIEKSTFTMGYPVNRKVLFDVPSFQSGQYEILIDEYWISKFPVTNFQFSKFVNEGGYSHKGRRFWTEAGWIWKNSKNVWHPAYWDDPKWAIDNHPVVGVSWFEAVAYCLWLSEISGKNFRLPTEAEWEKASSGANGFIWPWGSKFDEKKANTIESGICQTTCVGLFVEGGSSWGIFDLSGNVWEWCNSEFRSYGEYNAQDGRENKEGTIPRCVRGGSWLNNKDRSRVANRDHYHSSDRHFDLGFRIAETK